MLIEFENHLKQKFPFLLKSKLLLAISGGIDSVVLAYLLKSLDLNIALAHCNFHLRGDESDADEAFLLQLADDMNLEIFIEHFDTEAYANSNKISVQMAARELRYNWFSELADQLKFDYILTAHHADDDLETFLINLSRGTGLDGLTGIPKLNGNIVRPLLKFSSSEIELYAKANKLEWRIDSSNESTKYLRNKIRHEVIPHLKELNDQFLENFKRTQGHLRDASLIIENHMNDLADDILNVKEDSIELKIASLKKLGDPKPYLFQLLKDYNFTEWDDVCSLLDAQSGKQVFSAEWSLLKDREVLILKRRSDSSFESISISNLVEPCKTPIGTLFFDEADAIFGKRTNVIFADKNKIKLPLTIRTWKEGDVFYPLGMKGKKKLSKYFKDEKLSLYEKENTLLLCSEEEIVWVIGKRADERFKATEKTSDILKIELRA